MARLTGIVDVASAAALRALAVTAQDSDKVYLPGVGFYDWAPTSTEADDGLYFIQPTAVTGAGRWVLVPDTAYTVAIKVKNQTGASIAKGTVLMAVGTLGASGVITAAPMDGTDPANYKFILGIADSAIADGGDGEAVSFGEVRHLPTSAFLDGDVLWVSTTQAGALVKVEPTAGLKMPVAFVVSSHATNGTLMVRVTPSNENHWVAQSFETVAKNLTSANATFSYDGTGSLTSIAYANGITKTLGRTAGRLTTVTLSGSVPSGVALVKTLSYTDDRLTGISYSF